MHLVTEGDLAQIAIPAEVSRTTIARLAHSDLVITRQCQLAIEPSILWMRTVTTSASAELLGTRDYCCSQIIEKCATIVMQFTRIVGPNKEMQAWSASSTAASFVISHESRSGAGF